MQPQYIFVYNNHENYTSYSCATRYQMLSALLALCESNLRVNSRQKEPVISSFYVTLCYLEDVEQTVEWLMI